jgi:hypothetical protein
MENGTEKPVNTFRRTTENCFNSKTKKIVNSVLIRPNVLKMTLGNNSPIAPSKPAVIK